MNRVLTVRARVDFAGAGDADAGAGIYARAGIVKVRGRAAWALVELVDSGTGGCSCIDYPSQRMTLLNGAAQ